MAFKSGYVAIIGKPNVGKSTLLNVLLGQKISIVTNKPQTTRKRILGIHSGEDHQIVFLDTPGILNPNYKLQEKLIDYIHQSVIDADVLLFIIDVGQDPYGDSTLEDILVQSVLKRKVCPKILILNKVDLSNETQIKSIVERLEKTGEFVKIIPVSALLNFNIELVRKTLFEYIPEHTAYYPLDIIAEENERFFVSEIIREKIFELFKEEIPYSCEVVIEDFKEREESKDFISATIFVEKNGQKGIIIGKEGSAIKNLGQSARIDIEQFLGREVFLDLRVKVKSKWRSDEKLLKYFGYIKEM